MSNFKSQYTEEEINVLLHWFQERLDTLPATLRLDEATFIFDLPLAVHGLMYVVENNFQNVNFGGSVKMLFDLKTALEKN